MNLRELPPSKQWAVLKHAGRQIAGVWFKPEGEPFAVSFRIPQASFQIPGVSQRLTIETLLKAVGLAVEEVESWRYGGGTHPSVDEPDPELRHPLPTPADGVDHLTVIVRLKPPTEETAANDSREPAMPLAKWQELEARWNAILGLEASIDTLRLRMESLRAEMEGAAKARLSTGEKVNALNADVVVWEKAKSRVHYAQPKATEFIRRATWALGTPERKKLGELFKNQSGPPMTLSPTDKIPEQLQHLLKDRQDLSAHGVAVYQECQSITAGVQGALRTLQGNAAANATRKRGITRKKGKMV